MTTTKRDSVRTSATQVRSGSVIVRSDHGNAELVHVELARGPSGETVIQRADIPDAIAALRAFAESTGVDAAVIAFAGIALSAPRKLAELAGWTVRVDGVATDETHNHVAQRRLVRAISERRQNGSLMQDDPGMVRDLLSRCVELAEIEGAEQRREQARYKIAELELRAATDRLAAARLESQRARGGE